MSTPIATDFYSSAVYFLQILLEVESHLTSWDGFRDGVRLDPAREGRAGGAWEKPEQHQGIATKGDPFRIDLDRVSVLHLAFDELYTGFRPDFDEYLK